MPLRKIYKNIRNQLPASMQSKMTEMVFRFSGKPFVLKDDIPNNQKFPNGEKGGMIISADFELAWAWRYAKNYQDPLSVALKMARQARDNFPHLINLFDTYSVPVTWATVGHLFLEKCEKEEHKWMKRIPYFENRVWSYNEGDWYDADPCTSWKNANQWYAPDLIRMIQDAQTNHEISTHTFSHIDFSDENCPSQTAEDELSACIEAMEPYGLHPESIVFPGGTWGNIAVVKKFGIQIYRKNIDVDLAYPFRDKFGLLVSPTSTGFMRNHSSWSSEYYIKRFKKYIDKAIQTHTIAHFWFHPSVDKWTLEKVMPEVMQYVSALSEKNDLWIGTMSEIKNHINNNKIN